MKLVFCLILIVCCVLPGQPASSQATLNTASTADAESALQDIYDAQNNQPLWFQQNQPTEQLLELLKTLRNAADHGLRAHEYGGIELTYRLTTLVSDQSPDARTQLDRDISRSALRFLQHLHYGRIDPRKAGFDLPRGRNDLDPGAALLALAATSDMGKFLQTIEPAFSHYQLLKQALARYRLLTVDEELTHLPTFAAHSIKPGESYAGAPALRRLLVAEQDMQAVDAAPDADATLDGALVEALKAYQTRHGLTADGVLGAQTFTALTTPFSQRVEQIELTLERWRWLPPLQSPMIVVNIPQFKLFAFNAPDDREASLLRMDVIVGQAYEHTRTPVFLSDMKYVVFRPYWDVPRNIVTRELLPAIQKDPDYLARHDMELVNGQGDRSPVVAATPDNIKLLAGGKLRVRQRPGAGNALGEVKFMLPNAYNVYLHSTPAKELFTQSRRAFSHGCIRVSDPVALAEYVLRQAQGEWHTQRIVSMMQGEANQRVNLDKTIPVLIVYGVVMPLESGAVQFFEDIYGHDRQLAKLLAYPRG